MSWKQTFVSNGLILGAGLVGGVLSARLLGVEDRGQLAALTYWPHFLAGMMTLGLNEAIVVRVARQGVGPQLVSTITTLSLGMAFCTIFVGVCLMPWMLGNARGEYINFARFYLAVFVPATFLAMNLLAIDQGRMDFRRFNYQRVLQAVLYPVLLGLLWSVDRLTVINAALAVLAGTAVIAVLRLWSARAALFAYPSEVEARALLATGWRIHLFDALTHSVAQADKMVLILLSSNAALGLYVAAQTLANAMQALLTQTFVNLMLPGAAQSLDLRDIVKSLRMMLACSLAVCAAVIVVLPWAVSLLFGHEFTGAAGIARILAIAATITGLKKSLLYVLRARDIHRTSVTAEGAAAVVMALGAIPAIHWRDAFGLAILVTLTQTVSLLVIWRGFLGATGVKLKVIIGIEANHD